jgi:hypothetical protein
VKGAAILGDQGSHIIIQKRDQDTTDSYFNSATPESFQEVHNIQLILDLQIHNSLQYQR